MNEQAPDDGTQPSGNRKIMPRHKRQALRYAKQIGLAPSSEDEAVRMLQERGVDIFSLKNSILDIARAEKMREEQADPSGVIIAENQPVDISKPPGPLTAAQREIEINKIRLDLVRRRRRRLFMLVCRLLFFVFLPTAICGYYYYSVATDMYETESAFLIQTAESGGGGSGLGAFLAGSGLATSQDSIVVQDYLLSREAFQRLDADQNYVEHFLNPEIDELQRIPEGASLDKAYAVYKRNVSIGFDPSEGVVRMRIIASTPEASQRFAEALVGYAEERVDGLSLEARGDQVTGAEARYDKAEQQFLEAQQKVLDLQQQRGVLSADAEITSQLSIINTLEADLENKRLSLSEILDNPRPNQSRASALQREIARQAERIEELRSRMLESNDSTVPIARISAELQVAETEMATRQALLQQSLTAVEGARIQESKQVRYLSLGVKPIAPVDPTYPKKFESTALAFLIFMSIYVMVSLTLSILREQVSV